MGVGGDAAKGGSRMLARLAAWLGMAEGVVLVGAGIFLALLVGSIARLVHLHRLPPATARSLRLRLRSWWVVAGVVGAGVVLGPTATVILMGGISLLALREYVGLIPDPEGGRIRALRGWLVAATILQYAWIELGSFVLFLAFIPVAGFLGLTLRVVLTRDPTEFRHLVGTLQWGLMLLVFNLSHVAWLLAMPESSNPVGGTIGWFLFLVILTEFNDIAQALWGRPFGRHKIIPEISPGKSWEGLIGALLCTIVVSSLLAPLLTPLADPAPRLAGTPLGEWLAGLPLPPWPILIAVGITIAGFCGDIVISAFKRDLHVKDSGTLLPGQGGILDRIDSLTFTAPLFLYLVLWLRGGAS